MEASQPVVQSDSQPVVQLLCRRWKGGWCCVYVLKSRLPWLISSWLDIALSFFGIARFASYLKRRAPKIQSGSECCESFLIKFETRQIARGTMVKVEPTQLRGVSSGSHTRSCTGCLYLERKKLCWFSNYGMDNNKWNIHSILVVEAYFHGKWLARECVILHTSVQIFDTCKMQHAFAFQKCSDAASIRKENVDNKCTVRARSCGERRTDRRLLSGIMGRETPSPVMAIYTQ